MLTTSGTTVDKNNKITIRILKAVYVTNLTSLASPTKAIVSNAALLRRTCTSTQDLFITITTQSLVHCTFGAQLSL